MKQSSRIKAYKKKITFSRGSSERNKNLKKNFEDKLKQQYSFVRKNLFKTEQSKPTFDK